MTAEFPNPPIASTAIWQQGASIARAYPRARALAVADVIDPPASVAERARRASEAFAAHLEGVPSSELSADALGGALQRAHRAVFDPDERASSIFALSGTVSLAALCFAGSRLAVANIGNCRCYRLRDGRLDCLSRGHVASESWGAPVRAGDRFLLCTSGFWAAIGESAILNAMSAAATAQRAQQLLTGAQTPAPAFALAVAYARGGADHPEELREDRHE